MAYQIKAIESVNPDSYPFYFFDSNVWIAQLQSSINLINDPRLEPYLTFFEGIVNLHTITDSKLLKKIRCQPKIIVTSLLLSEIFNGYMRQIAMRVYYDIQATKDGAKAPQELKAFRSRFDFKKDYRKTDDYKEKLRRLKSDFLAFRSFIDFRDDRFVELDPQTLIREINQDSDFNDFYYYYSLAAEGVPIVTDDGDFIFQDIPIITNNPKLLKVGRM